VSGLAARWVYLVLDGEPSATARERLFAILGAPFEPTVRRPYGLSPLEIWCNEAQECYVLAVSPGSLGCFAAICARERCPHAPIGEATAERRLLVLDRESNTERIDREAISLPMDVLFGRPPRLRKFARRERKMLPAFDTSRLSLEGAVERLLRLPAIADKRFLITIGDRSVSGLGRGGRPNAVKIPPFGSATNRAVLAATSLDSRTPTAEMVEPG
jgi:phosphoribosylformylglycinamidine (FGAM) synthase-like enzyme